MDGNPVDFEAWAEMFETAVGAGSVAEVMSFNDYDCADGAGTIRVSQHVRFDFGEITIEDLGQGRMSTGTWTLEGTGDYEPLRGSGEIVNDNDTGVIHLIGEVEG